MPQPKNHLLRTLVPILVGVMGIFIAVAVWKNSSKVSPPPMATPTGPSVAGAAAASPAIEPTPGPTQATNPDAPAVTPVVPEGGVAVTARAATETATQTPAQPAAPAPVVGYRVEPVENPVPAQPLGSIDPDGPYAMQVEFSAYGAGVKSLTLAQHFETIKDAVHVKVQEEKTHARIGERPLVMTPFGALAIEITPAGGSPQVLDLQSEINVWRAIDGRPGAFEAFIVNPGGERVLRIERAYTLPEHSHNLTLSQRLTNLSPTPMSVRFFETGVVDLPAEAGGYGGDKRRVRFGYLLDPAKDPAQAEVISAKLLSERREALGKNEPEKELWPNELSRDNGYNFSWSGMTNRYFGVAAYPVMNEARMKMSVPRSLGWVAGVDRILLDPLGEVMGTRLDGAPTSLAAAGTPGDTADLSHAIYAGPLDRRALSKDPETRAAGLPGLVVFNFGGFCASCTFGFMTSALLWILHSLHDFIFHDWALAIVFLVLIVRTCLHPVTKWSQIRMAKFGKQMGAVGPKQKVLQEKYKSDPRKLQEETAKLWREEGISPTGMLGCLPMMLQTPVWIALYASLYFSVELRHTGAFYGVFQHIQPLTSPLWRFMGDLSEPDRLIYFGREIASLPLLGPIVSLNILPLLLGVVFFIQQKYLTPPTTGTLTPEQEFQQKMMKIMTVVLFPVAMYNAPSGLAIYFICNSTFAILESRYIRSHMDKYGMLDLEKMRTQRQAKGSAVQTGMMGRLLAMAEERQKQAMNKGRRPKR